MALRNLNVDNWCVNNCVGGDEYSHFRHAIFESVLQEPQRSNTLGVFFCLVTPFQIVAGFLTYQNKIRPGRLERGGQLIYAVAKNQRVGGWVY